MYQSPEVPVNLPVVWPGTSAVTAPVVSSMGAVRITFSTAFPEIRFIHDRMPVILSESMIGDWINPENNEEDVVLEALVDMVFDKAC